MDNETDDENILISRIIDEKYECKPIVINRDGKTGPQGPTFVNAYSTSEQKIEKNGFVFFDNTNAICGDCFHVPNTSEIFIWRTGFYSIYISIFHLESCQFSLLKNSIYIAPASTVGSFFTSSQNSNYFIIQLTNEDMITPTFLSPSGYACKLQFINYTNRSYMPYVSLIGSYSAGNIIPQITATTTIISL
jgi:hypothetical protein